MISKQIHKSDIVYYILTICMLEYIRRISNSYIKTKQIKNAMILTLGGKGIIIIYYLIQQ